MAHDTRYAKVLVVDDEVFVRMLVADVLDDAVFEVVENIGCSYGSGAAGGRR